MPGQPSQPSTIAVDLDGTLTPTDTLWESLLVLVKQRPWLAAALPLWAAIGRSRLKDEVAARVRLNVEVLPWRQDLVDWLGEQRSAGRRIVLTTAAHDDIAQATSDHLGLFDEAWGSSRGLNLKGKAKLAALRERFGNDFVYVGDSRADLPIWAGAQGAVLAGASKSTRRLAQGCSTVLREFDAAPPTWRDWLSAIRVHQWSKNLLLFVPLFISFGFTEAAKLLAVLLSFFAFSFAASGTYLLNDMWDLDSDRRHERKRHRALACGRITIPSGLAAAAALVLAGVALAFAVSVPVGWMLLGYVVLTTAYSWALKTYVLVDVLTLALLYTYRVIAGGVAIAVTLTPWLLAFSVFVFFSLALVKRCGELAQLQAAGGKTTAGRDYRVSDLAVLWPLGVGASLCSVVVFGLYITTDQAQETYRTPALLWLTAVALLYWLARLWVKAARAEMHDDPIVFAFKDRGSRLCVAVIMLLTVAAHQVPL